MNIGFFSLANRARKVLGTAAVLSSLAMAANTALAASSAHDLTPLDAYLAYLKLSNPSDLADYVTEYDQHFSPPHGLDTEFTKADRQAKLLDLMKRNVANFNLSEPVSINTNAEFGDYDFDAKSFDFRPVSAAAVFKIGSLDLVFVNTGSIEGLPMDPAKAKAFAEAHTFRSLPVVVTFVPVEAIEGSNRLKGKITQVDVFADSQHLKLISTLMPKS